jgi:hypothetical protein
MLGALLRCTLQHKNWQQLLLQGMTAGISTRVHGAVTHMLLCSLIVSVFVASWLAGWLAICLPACLPHASINTAAAAATADSAPQLLLLLERSIADAFVYMP